MQQKTIPLSSSKIDIGCRFNFDIFDQKGHVLLPRGNLVLSVQEATNLRQHGRRLPEDKNTASAFTVMQRIAERLTNLFNDIKEGHNKGPQRINQIKYLASDFIHIADQEPDAAFASIHLNIHHSYLVVHSLMAAMVCARLSMTKEWDEKARLSLIAAALTHDIGMLDFYQLINSRSALSEADIHIIKTHATRSVQMLKGFGVDNLPNGVVAAGSILHYLDLTHHQHTGHITQLARIEEDRYVWLDRFTVRNLELYGSINEGAKTLVDILDKTISPMGARLLKRWIAFPLKDVKPINERLSVVEFFFRHPDLKLLLEQNIALIGDLERIISKVAVGRINPREVVQLKVALKAIEPIKEACAATDNITLQKIADQLNACHMISEKIEKEVNNDPPTLINRGNIMRYGIDADLDELFLRLCKEEANSKTINNIVNVKKTFNNNHYLFSCHFL